jgi:hypothetical protein
VTTRYNTADKRKNDITEIKCLRKAADHTLQDEIHIPLFEISYKYSTQGRRFQTKKETCIKTLH